MGKNIIIAKKGKYVKLNNYERNIKSPFIIYADFESILVSEDNRKQSPNQSYTNKYERHIPFSYGCKLVCVDEKFRKPLKT